MSPGTSGIAPPWYNPNNLPLGILGISFLGQAVTNPGPLGPRPNCAALRMENILHVLFKGSDVFWWESS